MRGGACEGSALPCTHSAHRLLVPSSPSSRVVLFLTTASVLACFAQLSRRSIPARRSFLQTPPFVFVVHAAVRTGFPLVCVALLLPFGAFVTEGALFLSTSSLFGSVLAGFPLVRAALLLRCDAFVTEGALFPFFFFTLWLCSCFLSH